MTNRFPPEAVHNPLPPSRAAGLQHIDGNHLHEIFIVLRRDWIRR